MAADDSQYVKVPRLVVAVVKVVATVVLSAGMSLFVWWVERIADHTDKMEQHLGATDLRNDLRNAVLEEKVKNLEQRK